MMGRWVLVGLILAGIAIPAARSHAAQEDRAGQVIAEVNAYRAALGLNALEVHPSLMVAAQTHVDWMVRTGEYGHTGEGGSSPAQRAAAAGYPTAGWYVYENWVGGSDMTPFEAVLWWDQSPIHQQTLRLQGFEHIGVGYATDGNSAYYVLIVAKPSLPTGGAADSAASADDGGADQGAPESGGDGEPTAAPVMVPVVRSTPGPDGSIVHEVRQGQTAWTIAAVYGVDLMELVTINNLGPDGIIRPGDRIIVRLGEGQSPPAPPTTHTVQAGETAWTIAALYGLTLDDLLTLNGIDRSTVLYPGDTVIIRRPDPAATPTDIPTITPTFAPLPTRSDITLAPTWTLSPTWSPTPTETPAPPTPTITPTATFRPAVGRSVPDSRHGPDRALLVSVGVVGVGTLLLAGGALASRWRQGR